MWPVDKKLANDLYFLQAIFKDLIIRNNLKSLMKNINF